MSRTFLLSWNPDKNGQDSLASLVAELQRGGVPRISWSVTKSNQPRVGDRAYLVKVGSKGRGMVAVGSIVSDPLEGEHYDPELAEEGKTLNYVDVDLLGVVEGLSSQVINHSELEAISNELGCNQEWLPQNSGIEIDPVVAPHLDRLWSQKYNEPSLVAEDEYLRYAGQLDGSYSTTRRLEQRYLRKELFRGATFDSCALCGERMPVAFLVAAHIKKRSECSDEEKRDIDNIVLPMCTFGCDALFEAGYVVVQAGKIVKLPASSVLDKVENYLAALHGRRVEAYTDKNRIYFDWHCRYYTGEG